MLGLPKGSILFSALPSNWELYQNWEHVCDSIAPVSSFSARELLWLKAIILFSFYLILFHFYIFF